MYETSLDKVLNYMKQYVENKFEHDSEPMLNYKDLELVLNYIDKYKQVIDKIKEIVDKAPCLWYVDEELERVDGTIDLTYEEYTGWKNILELLEEIE